MRVKLLSTVWVGSVMALGGCASQPVELSAVAVRIAPVPDFDPFLSAGDDQAVTASMPDGRTSSSDYVAASSASPAVDAFTVSLWGGMYQGDDVTFTDASLEPGDYTFGFWDHERDRALKGWVNVNFAGTEVTDTLRRWRDRIPQQKQWLAYDYEIKGKLDTADSKVFKSFARQLRAFDKLDRDLERAIAHETTWRQERTQRYNTLLGESVVLVLPTGSGVFHPTTQPVFASEDVSRVQDGEPMTKFMLVADARDAREKLHTVDRVCRSLVGCRAVLTEEVERLERRHRYYITTDHIYNHDRKFVENEMRLQQCLAGIDQLNEEIGEMRERRLALAFTNGLVSPDRFFDPLESEQRDAAQERTVLSTQKHRLDLMFDDTAEDSPRRVALERQRQRTQRAIEDLDHYDAALDEARVALSGMKEGTRVIHRQGDMRLLAAGFMDASVPSCVREAVERDAVMTVRLEPSATMFGPSYSVAPTARTASYDEPCDP